MTRIKYIVFAAALTAISACSAGSSPAPAILAGEHANGSHASETIVVNLEAARATTQAARDVADVRISFPGSLEPIDIILANGVCTTCSVTMNVPANTAVFTFDTLDASGKLLSHTSIPSIALENTTNINLSLVSRIGSVGIASDDDRPAFGKRAVTTLFVWARDRAYSFIIGAGAYTPPIVLTQAAQPGGMHLSKTEMRSAGDSLPTVAYPGGFQSASVTARAGHSAATILVAPRVPVTSVTLPSIPKPFVAAAGNYVWTYLWTPTGDSIERLDVVHGTKRNTPLSVKAQDPGALTATSDGSLWYAACQADRLDASLGVGHVTAAGSAEFFETEAMTAFVCPNLAIATDGAIWFSSGTDLTRMSPTGVFATVDVTPPPKRGSQFSDIGFAKNGGMWMIDGPYIETGAVVHVSASGKVFGSYGGENFLSMATGRDRIYAIGWKAISVFDLSGALQSTFSLHTERDAPQTVSPDGSLWFEVGADVDQGYAIVARIAPNGSVWEFSVPADGSYISALAADGEGSIWFPYSYSPKIAKIEL